MPQRVLFVFQSTSSFSLQYFYKISHECRIDAQVTVAVLLNCFVGAITVAEEQAAIAATKNLKSKELLRWARLENVRC